jgi:hypothetical protein
MTISDCLFNPLNAELNPICQLLALVGAHHILHVSRLRVKDCDVDESIVGKDDHEAVTGHGHGLIFRSVSVIPRVCPNSVERALLFCHIVISVLHKCRSVQPFKAYRLLYVPPGLTFKNSAS